MACPQHQIGIDQASGQDQTVIMETVECSTCGSPLYAVTAYMTLFRCNECVVKDNEYLDRLSEEMDDRIEDAFLRECHED